GRAHLRGCELGRAHRERERGAQRRARPLAGAARALGGRCGLPRAPAGASALRRVDHLAVCIFSSEKTKSCFSSGLWQLKQALRLALSFTDRSGFNAWYSHSPLRVSSGYSVPQPARFSMTAMPAISSVLMKRPVASFSGSPAALSLAL